MGSRRKKILEELRLLRPVVDAGMSPTGALLLKTRRDLLEDQNAKMIECNLHTEEGRIEQAERIGRIKQLREDIALLTEPKKRLDNLNQTLQSLPEDDNDEKGFFHNPVDKR